MSKQSAQTFSWRSSNIVWMLFVFYSFVMMFAFFGMISVPSAELGIIWCFLFFGWLGIVRYIIRIDKVKLLFNGVVFGFAPLIGFAIHLIWPGNTLTAVLAGGAVAFASILAEALYSDLQEKKQGSKQV